MVQIMSGSRVLDYNNYFLLKGELKIFHLSCTTNCLQLYTYLCTVLQCAPAVITTIKTTAVPREFSCVEEGSCSRPLLLGKFIIYNTQFSEWRMYTHDERCGPVINLEEYEHLCHDCCTIRAITASCIRSSVLTELLLRANTRTHSCIQINWYTLTEIVGQHHTWCGLCWLNVNWPDLHQIWFIVVSRICCLTKSILGVSWYTYPYRCTDRPTKHSPK